jgi:hypothetical protein
MNKFHNFEKSIGQIAEFMTKPSALPLTMISVLLLLSSGQGYALPDVDVAQANLALALLAVISWGLCAYFQQDIQRNKGLFVPMSSFLKRFCSKISLSMIVLLVVATGYTAHTQSIVLNSVCPATTVNLNTAVSVTNLPAGTTLSWHTSAVATAANKIANPASVGAGTFYASFQENSGTCFSPTSVAVTVAITSCAPPCNTGNTPVQLSASTLSNTCPATSVNLNSLITSSTPAGTSVVWYSNATHTGTALSTPMMVSTAGTYYAFYYDNVNNCYSPASAPVSVSINTCNSTPIALANTCPAQTVNLNTAITVSNIPAGTTLTWHSGTPATALNQVASPASVGAGTYYASFQENVGGCFSPTSVAVNVSINPCGTVLAVNDIASTLQNVSVSGSVLTNDITNGLPVSVTPLTAAVHGSLVLNSNGTFVYTPTNGFVGKDSVQYQLCPVSIPAIPVQCSTAWLHFGVNAPAATAGNTKPMALPDVAQTVLNTSVSGQVTNNDTDADGNSLTATLISQPSNGVVAMSINGNFTYIPNNGFTGTDKFRYRICDNGAPSMCDTASVTVYVMPLTGPVATTNYRPNAQDDAFVTLKNVQLTADVSPNDTDPNGTAGRVYNIVTPTSNGSVLINTAGQFTYIPNGNFVGSDYFRYKVCDAGSPSLCDTATVYLTIMPTPTATCLTMNLKVLLEGPYKTSTGLMSTVLNQRGLLPGQVPIGDYGVASPAGQPFNTAPWNYTGTETASSYASTVVDWVLVSLRTGTTLNTTVFRQAGLLHSNGSISFSNPCLSVPNGLYHVVIEHRNHTGVMSPSQVSIVGGTLSFDFTLAESYILNNPPSFGQKLLSNGKYVMMAGDGKKNDFVNNYDINFNDSLMWKLFSGIFDQYQMADFNLDADVNFADNVLWKSNNGKYSAVPH